MRIFFTLFLFVSISVFPQTEYKLELVGRVWFPGQYQGNDTTGTSDCWGYTAPDGTEYAIIGIYDGIAFVRIPDLKIIDVIPGPKNNDYYFHRDIKTYKHYAYAVAEMLGENQGLMIMDLQYLPDSVHFIKSYSIPSQIRSHNFTIDTAKGFAYICAQNYVGFRVVDLSDPENPAEVNLVGTSNIHDVYARNDTVYVAEGYNSTFSIYNLADKDSAVLIKRWASPSSGYAHNIWASDDGKYVMTTEETLNRTVKYWDISDIEDIHIRGEYLAENNIAHNAHIMRDLAYISHYRGGLRVIDLTNPDSLKEAAAYDTYGGQATGNFYGNWGAYPFTKNGYVFASDFEGWLTVLKLVETPVRTEDLSNLPDAFVLEQNFPNPFNPLTTITFLIKETAFVKIEIFNSLGEKAAILTDEIKSAGLYQINFNGKDLSSGAYFYRLTAESINNENKIFSQTRQMILLK